MSQTASTVTTTAKKSKKPPAFLTQVPNLALAPNVPAVLDVEVNAEPSRYFLSIFILFYFSLKHIRFRR
jgi:hypothetical protein